MARFIGEYNHQLDAKNRLRIPAKLRKELGDEYYFHRGTGKCINVVTKEEMDSILDKLSQVRNSDIELQRSVRALSSSFVQAVEDNQGRVVLPGDLRRKASMGDEKELVIVGVVNRIEIWTKSAYEEYLDSLEDFDTLVSKLTDY